MNIFHSIINCFRTKRQEIIKKNESYQTMEDILEDGASFYDKEDLVYFPNLNVYGAFKYNIVRDIFANSKTITVSEIHRSLNGTYFSLKESEHQHNKKIAYKHLDFLSKQLVDKPNSFTQKLYNYYSLQFPMGETFDLTQQLIQPLLFTSILNDYGFLSFMPEFNPFSDQYHHPTCIQKINSYFEDSQEITTLFEEYLKNTKTIPSQMQQFLAEIQSDQTLTDKSVAQFFSSMIFSGTHSTVSFLSTLIYKLFNQFPEILQLPLDKDKLESLENELLRIYTPVQWVFRTVREATNYNGIDLKVGDTVILFVGFANVDPNIFDDPYTIQLQRTTNHLAFGMGPYACIGRFATRRMAQNLTQLIANKKDNYTLVNLQHTYTIENALIRTPLQVEYNERVQ